MVRALPRFANVIINGALITITRRGNIDKVIKALTIDDAIDKSSADSLLFRALVGVMTLSMLS